MKPQTIKQEVKPFLKEWKSLSHGELHPVKIGPWVIKVFFYWVSDSTPSYVIRGMYYGDAFLMERGIPASEAYLLFKSKIDNFIQKTKSYGLCKHKDEDYLWNNYFWKVDA